jgi:uridylate kinase
MTKVISVGGSIVSPDKVDVDFLKNFTALVKQFLQAFSEARFILVTGGGAPARAYQAAYREISGAAFAADSADLIGIAATRLNAEILRQSFGALAPQAVVEDPSAVGVLQGRVLVAGGWKPGFSSDYDAVLLALRFGAGTVINLSNIAQVYTADPGADKNAAPLTTISWADFRKLVGNDWAPGANVPFDPVASALAQKENIKVICAHGRDYDNINKILRGEEFFGTTIG